MRRLVLAVALIFGLISQSHAGTMLGMTYSGGPTFSAHFTPSVLDNRFTFTRATDAWYYNSSGILTKASSGSPRFDYDPTTLAYLGLRIEPQGTNYSPYPITFNTQRNRGVVITPNSAISPDGTQNAGLVERTTTAANYIQDDQAGSKAPNSANVCSMFVKHASTRYFAIRVQGNYPAKVDAVFDFTNSNWATAPVISGTATNPLGGYQQLPNGWWRVWASGTLDSGTSFSCVFAPVNTNIQVDGTDSLASGGTYMWGEGVEKNRSTPTSPIVQSSGAYTRNSESLKNTNIPWFNATEGTFVTAAILNSSPASANAYLASFSDGTTANYIAGLVNTSGAAQANITISSSAYTSAASAGSPTVKTLFKEAVSYKSTTNAMAYAGAADGAGTFGGASLPGSISALQLGDRSDGTLTCDCWLVYFNYWNKKVGSSQLLNVSN